MAAGGDVLATLESVANVALLPGGGDHVQPPQVPAQTTAFPAFDIAERWGGGTATHPRSRRGFSCPSLPDG
jgi:hypothetical protein